MVRRLFNEPLTIYEDFIVPQPVSKPPNPAAAFGDASGTSMTQSFRDRLREAVGGYSFKEKAKEGLSPQLVVELSNAGAELATDPEMAAALLQQWKIVAGDVDGHGFSKKCILPDHYKPQERLFHSSIEQRYYDTAQRAIERYIRDSLPTFDFGQEDPDGRIVSEVAHELLMLDVWEAARAQLKARAKPIKSETYELRFPDKTEPGKINKITYRVLQPKAAPVPEADFHAGDVGEIINDSRPDELGIFTRGQKTDFETKVWKEVVPVANRIFTTLRQNLSADEKIWRVYAERNLTGNSILPQGIGTDIAYHPEHETPAHTKLKTTIAGTLIAAILEAQKEGFVSAEYAKQSLREFKNYEPSKKGRAAESSAFAREVDDFFAEIWNAVRTYHMKKENLEGQDSQGHDISAREGIVLTEGSHQLSLTYRIVGLRLINPLLGVNADPLSRPINKNPGEDGFRPM